MQKSVRPSPCRNSWLRPKTLLPIQQIQPGQPHRIIPRTARLPEGHPRPLPVPWENSSRNSDITSGTCPRGSIRRSFSCCQPLSSILCSLSLRSKDTGKRRPGTKKEEIRKTGTASPLWFGCPGFPFPSVIFCFFSFSFPIQ